MAPIGCQLCRSLSVPVSSLTTCERGAVIVEGLGVNMAPPRVPTGAAYGGAKIDVASAAGMHCQVGMFAMLSRSVAVSLHYPLLPKISAICCVLELFSMIKYTCECNFFRPGDESETRFRQLRKIESLSVHKFTDIVVDMQSL